MQAKRNPAETFLESLIAGDNAGIASAFAGEPMIDDPLGGAVRSGADLPRYIKERQAWLAERHARVEPLRTTHNDLRTVFESLLHLQPPGGSSSSEMAQPPGRIALPVAVVADHAGERVSALRIYHSLWPLIGAHRVRAPLLPHDPSLSVSDVVGEYQRALATGDVAAIVDTFEPDGMFREPAGGEYIYQGRDKLLEFMAHLFAGGGIGLEHCTVTDDGVACAIEFNAVHFGAQRLTPQAGVAVYERGRTGRLHAARVYDDVNVEALAG